MLPLGRVFWSIAAIAGFALALSAGGASLAAAEVGDGPAIATIKLAGSQGNRPLLRAELDLLNPFGLDSMVLASGRATLRHATRGMPMPFDAPTWAGDGSELAFTGANGKRNQIFMVGIGDGRLRPVPKTVGGSNPILSVDGSFLVFARTREWTHIDPKHFKFKAYESTSTWLLDLNTMRVRRLTPWRNGLAYWPSSFSPNSSVLLLSRLGDDGKKTIVAERLSDGALSTVARDAEQAAYSPDGSKVAFIGYRNSNVDNVEGNFSASDVYVMNLNGGGRVRLSHTPHAEESSPSWDPSRQRIAFVRSQGSYQLSLELQSGNRLMEVNVDGTCARPIFKVPKLRGTNPPEYYGAAWRPGPGREAGSISC